MKKRGFLVNCAEKGLFLGKIEPQWCKQPQSFVNKWPMMLRNVYIFPFFSTRLTHQACKFLATL